MGVDVVNGEEIDMAVENISVKDDAKKKKKKKKKKKEKKEKKKKDSVLEDVIVEVEVGRGRSGVKGKKRKLDSESNGGKEGELKENDEIGMEVVKDKKKKKRRKVDASCESGEGGEEVEIEVERNDEVNASVHVEDGEVDVGKKEKKKTRKNKKTDKSVANDEEGNDKEQIDGLSNVDSGDAKKRKKRKKRKDETEKCTEEILEEPDNNESGLVGKEKGEKSRKSTKKKAKSTKNGKEKDVVDKETRTQNKEKNADRSGGRKSKKSSKHVKFSDKDEIFPLPEGGNAKKKNQKEGLVRGKRFTKEEDEIIRKAVLNYIQEHDLGEEGVQKVMRCSDYPETRNCWKVISTCLPRRPLNAIYNRGHILFERDEKHTWSQEEIDLLKEFHAKYGPDWRKFADEYGKSRIHTKDTWRRIGNPNRKKGAWTQEEYQKYFDLVNMDLRMKVFTEKKIKHGMLKDNIAWEAISSKLDTRSNADCCKKWYGQMQSPLVKAEVWSNSDDFRLIIELTERDYSSVEEVDWDDLLDHRPGEICRKRWHQMVRHTGEHANKSFADQVEVLMKRYCPDVLEPRQIYEDKEPVDC
ncbi:hypothetical protein ACHQM5_018304 [Ranunculus cassubicifolius]